MPPLWDACDAQQGDAVQVALDIGRLRLLKLHRPAALEKRPAAVVSTPAYASARPDVVLMAITSQVRTPLSFGEVLIADWQAAQLIKESVVKPLLATLE